jgi:hypothetical protein
VKQHVRHGLLGRMLRELLQTRVMVKQAMKGVRDDKGLRRVLDARQLGCVWYKQLFRSSPPNDLQIASSSSAMSRTDTLVQRTQDECRQSR